MKFAVKLYVQKMKIENTNLKLAAMSLSGEPPEVENFVEI